MAALKRFLVPGVIVALLVAAGFTMFNGGDQKTLTAHFPRAISIYEGSDVRVLGVPVGTVDKVTPSGTDVIVVMSYDAKIKIPADAKAAIIAPSIVGDRFVQLTPVYTDGDVIADGVVLDTDRTAAPLELDEIYSGLDKLNVALGPNGANSKGALTDLLETTAANFGGQGAFANGKINPDSPYADWFSFDRTQSEPDRQYRGWVGVHDLPEINKSSTSFRRFAYGDPDSVMLHWLDQGAAGWRMDVAPWVPDDFWREWRSAIRAHKPDALLVSETWFDASKFLLGDMFDSTMNYIFRNVVLDYAAGGDAQASYPSLELVREAYPPQALHALMNLLSGHDVARTLHVLGWKSEVVDPAAIALAKQRLRLAMFFQMSYPGAPAIFYGDEVGVTGGDDPYNRGTYPWADRGGKPDLALLADVKSLLAMRKAHPVLSHGSLDAPLLLDAHRIVLLRRDGAAWAVTATNNAQATTTVRVTLPADAPVSFRDGLTGEMHMVGADHVLEFSVPALFGTALFGSAPFGSALIAD